MPNGPQAHSARLQDPASRSTVQDLPVKPREAGATPIAAKSGQDGVHPMTEHSREISAENSRRSDSNFPGRDHGTAVEALSSPTIAGLLRGQPPNSRHPLQYRSRAADSGIEPPEPVDALPNAHWERPSQAPVSVGNRPREHLHDRGRRDADCTVGMRISEKEDPPCGGVRGERAMPTQKRSGYRSQCVPRSSVAQATVAGSPQVSPNSRKGNP